MPAQAVRIERERLWAPPADQRLENQSGLSDIVQSANEELRQLLSTAPQLQLRLTGTDSESVLESVVPHFIQGSGPTLPSGRQGTGLVSLQSLLLLMQFGKARADADKSFILAVEEPGATYSALPTEAIGQPTQCTVRPNNRDDPFPYRRSDVSAS